MPDREEAVEVLANELLLFRFGGKVVEGRYLFLGGQDGSEKIDQYHRDQARDNARRILEEDRLALRSQIERELGEQMAKAMRWLDEEIAYLEDIARTDYGDGQLRGYQKVRDEIQAALTTATRQDVEGGEER